MKFVLIIGVIILFMLVLWGGWYAYRGQTQSQKAAGTPRYFQNPFTKPNTSFGQTTTASAIVNPFATPTPTPYKNPFGSTGQQQYQNPFEKLR